MSETKPTEIVPAKPFYLSKTTWGVAVSAVALLLDKWGYHITDELQGETADHILKVIEAVGMIVATFGRWKATKPLTVASDYKSVPVTRLLLLLPLLLAGAGCQTGEGGPRAEFSKANDIFISLQTGLLKARSEKIIEESTWQNDVVPLLVKGDAALDIYDEITKASLSEGSYRDAVLQIIAELSPYLTQAEVTRAERIRSGHYRAPSGARGPDRRDRRRQEADEEASRGVHREAERGAQAAPRAGEAAAGGDPSGYSAAAAVLLAAA